MVVIHTGLCCQRFTQKLHQQIQRMNRLIHKDATAFFFFNSAPAAFFIIFFSTGPGKKCPDPFDFPKLFFFEFLKNLSNRFIVSILKADTYRFTRFFFCFLKFPKGFSLMSIISICQIRPTRCVLYTFWKNPIFSRHFLP